MTAEQNVVLVVPTFNRQHFLKRLIEYYGEQRISFPIVVADSSAPAIQAINKQTVSLFSNALSICHQSYSEDIRGAVKVATALDKCDSTFAVICGDDDFLIPQSIKSCVEFLTDHRDYSAAQGMSLAFQVDKRPDSGGCWSFHVVTTQSGQTLPHETAVDRLYGHLRSYVPTFYAVQLRKQFIHNLKIAAACTKDVRFGELLPSCLTVIQGKIKRFDMLHCVSEVHDGNTSAKADKWTDLFLADDYHSRYKSFKDSLVKEIMEIGGMDMREAGQGVEKAYLAYWKNVFSQYSVMEEDVLKTDDSGKELSATGFREFVHTIPVLGPFAVRLKRALGTTSVRAPDYGDEIVEIRERVLKHAESVYNSDMKGF